jgi:hypothetical protein
LKLGLAVGIASDVCLAVGIALVLYGVGTAVAHPSGICVGSFIGGCSYGLGDVGLAFFVGIGFLVASLIGFLVVVASYRRVLATRSGTAN